jgi:hypothetical protein
VTDPQPEKRARLIGVALAGAGALATPFLYAAFALPHPSGLLTASGPATPFSGVETHLHADPVVLAVVIVVGVPLFAVLVSLVACRRRPPVVRALAAAGLVALLCTPGILVIGHTTIPTLWTVARHLPLIRLVRPQRLSMFAWLIAAVGAGAWIATHAGSWRRWAAVGVALAALLPAIWLGASTSIVPATPLAHTRPAPGDNVAVVAGSRSHSRQYADLAFPAVWQVESGFSFRLANGYVGSFPPSLPVAVRKLMFDRPISVRDRAAALDWLRRKDVRSVLVVRPTADSLRRAQHLLGTTPARLRGAALFRVPR